MSRNITQSFCRDAVKTDRRLKRYALLANLSGELNVDLFFVFETGDIRFERRDQTEMFQNRGMELMRQPAHLIRQAVRCLAQLLQLSDQFVVAQRNLSLEPANAHR